MRSPFVFAAAMLLALTAPSVANASSRRGRPKDGRYVGGLVMGIAGTAGAVVTLDVLLFTHTCMVSGGCAPGQTPPSTSSAWPYVGVASAFAVVGAVGWYLFATPSTSADATGSYASTSPPPFTFGVAPLRGGASAGVSFTF